MSRRSVPPIDPTDLRDHADEARIDRIWERLEVEVAGVRAPERPRVSLWLVAAAVGVAAAFAGGVFVGRTTGERPVALAPAIRPVTVADRVDTDVFAAGSEGRTFELPGGGRLELSPGATVEMDRTSGGSLTLRLVQGEASVDTAGQAASSAVAIVAGEATLSTRPGSAVTVERHGDQVDVSVAGGSVKIDSPAGSRQLGRGERASGVPTRSEVATAPTAARRVRAPLTGPTQPGETAPTPPSVASGPEWLARYSAYKYDEAFELLAEQPGGVRGAIDAASDAELAAIADVAWKADRSAAVRALTRVLDDFPSGQYAAIAAYKLAVVNEGKSPALARKYAALSRSLSPNGNLDEDARCIELRSERRGALARQLAVEYQNKYPHGRCTDDAERILSGEATFADDGAGLSGDGGLEGGADAAPTGAHEGDGGAAAPVPSAAP
jgi:hypothetical protein